MSSANIHEAKTHFSSLLKRVERGEEVIISNAGKPIARLVRFEPPRRQIAPPGSMSASGGWISADFDATLDTLFKSLGEASE